MNIEFIDDDAAVQDFTMKPAVPVYRYYYPSTLAHFYTTTPSSEHLDGWTLEGIRFYAFGDPIPGTQPIYRYMNNADNTLHYYTNEGNGSPINGWTFEGIAWYDFAANDDRGYRNVLQVYQFQTNPNLYFYTSDPSKEILNGYSLIGSIGYVYDINAPYMLYGRLITENNGQCLGINIMEGGSAGTNEGLSTFGPFNEGDYVMVRARLAKKFTCIAGGSGTLIIEAIGAWTPPNTAV